MENIENDSDKGGIYDVSKCGNNVLYKESAVAWAW